MCIKQVPHLGLGVFNSLKMRATCFWQFLSQIMTHSSSLNAETLNSSLARLSGDQIVRLSV
jgi:hypothetical protein